MDAQRVREDREAIRRGIERLTAATGVPVAIGAIIGNGRTLQLCEWAGLRTPALHNLVVAPGAGVGGRVVSTRRPVGVSDYTRAKIISHEYDKQVQAEGLRSVAATPLFVGRDLRGVLYAAVHSPVRLGDKVLEEFTMCARRIEQDMAVADALRSRELIPAAGNAANRAGPSAEWEQVRATHSRLRMLANRVEDDALRAEIEELCDQMVNPVPVSHTAKLSARELDVLACVALGRTNVEAAAEMGIGAETVKSYLRSVMRKLGAHTRYEAVNAARRIGALP